MKILYWIIKGSSIVLLAPVVVAAIPGSILHFVAEEIDNKRNLNSQMKNPYE